MKKFLSILMVVALVLSLGFTAFAAEDTGSITVTNATMGEAYTVYKLFDAKPSFKLDENGQEVADGNTYYIDEDSQFFELLFGADGKQNNPYLSYTPAYNSTSGTVVKKDQVNDFELTTYLNNLVNDHRASLEPVMDTVVAVKDLTTDTLDTCMTPEKQQKLGLTNDPKNYELQEAPTVVFEDLPYGYYLVTSSLGATVTINSNTPDVSVIDKNQEPVPDFDKQVQIGGDADNPIWGDENTANIGDRFSYRISFTATNYDDDKKIQHYQIHDEKGDAIWAEFNSIKVFIDGEELEAGYYLSQGGENTNNWKYLGDWYGIDEADRDMQDVEWYLVHLGFDQFRITIPWLEGHTLTTLTGADNSVSYKLEYPKDAASKYDSPSKVEIIYDVVVEANAAIGGTTHGNRFNKAHASWTSEKETISAPPDEVVTRVYGLGILKDDRNTGENLAGAKFEIYRDYTTNADGEAVYSNPVYVIPTGIDGVYAVDTKGTAIENVSGSYVQDARTYYEYLRGADGNYILLDASDANSKVKNEDLEALGDNQIYTMVTPDNGKLVVLGLAKGTYYVIEKEPPAGYNAINSHVEMKAGEGSRSFVVFADKEGNVADIQQNDGNHTEYSYDVTNTIVHNSKGAQLPSTGGTGTFWLITIGSLVAIGFAVFMITNKKMSAYVD